MKSYLLEYSVQTLIDFPGTTYKYILQMIKKEDGFFILDSPIVINFKYLIKRVLLPFYDILFLSLLFLNRSKRIEKRYTVSICAIFKDEAHNFKEWIEFHKIVGAEHFYLYNNFSSDNFLDVLKPYIEEGLVTLTEWPFVKGQMKAYEHCFENHKNDSKWISFLDLDEFIVPIKSESLSAWLQKMERFPCVLVYWKMFGTSGLIEGSKEKLTIEQYTVSWEKLVNIGKVFWNTKYSISDYSSMHIISASYLFFGKKITIPPVNQFKKFVKWDIHRHGNFRDNNIDIQINHYWSKSFNDTKFKKFVRGDAFFGDTAPTRNLNSFMNLEFKNISSDYKIYKYLIGLKIALGLTDYLNKNE